MKRKWILLFACLFCTALCFCSYASAESDLIEKAVASSTCGNNLTWSLYDAGTLTISGSDAMEDYSWPSYTPWYNSYRNVIKAVVISPGVTSIGKGTFRDCSSLTSITIPDSVTSIGWKAFEGCTSLASILISGSVTDIENRAFYICENLSDVYFLGTADQWHTITIGGAGNDALLSARMHFLYQAKLALPSALTVIEEKAFRGCSAEMIVIPASVTMINAKAFSDCRNLKIVWFLGNNTDIASDAFEGCQNLVIYAPADSSPIRFAIAGGFTYEIRN